MDKRTCAVDTCNRPVVASGWCDPHYRRARRYGTPGSDDIGARKRGPKPTGRVCTVNGCGKKHKGNGYCHTHNTLFLRNGSPTRLPKRVPAVCAVEGCVRNERGKKGYCEGHLSRIKNHGHPGSAELRSPYAADAVCVVDGCGRPRLARDWCKTHYERWRVTSSNDDLGAVGKYVRVEVVNDTKNCTSCGRRLPLDSFGVISKKMSYSCKDCDVLMAALRGKGPRQRAERLGVCVDRDITVLGLRDRDGSCCYLCGEEMSFQRYRRGNYNPRRASLDHVYPLSRGGTHSWDNVKLACLRCNISKNANVLDEK